MSTEEDRKGDSGRVSGSIYCGDHDHYQFLVEAFGYFAHANVLQRDMYPSATKMEAEIIAMTADILHGDDDTGGLVTSGGTESLVTAMLTYREWGRNAKGIARPQVIMPVTAHPGHSKAFHYFDIDVVIAPVDEHRRSTSSSCATTSVRTRWRSSAVPARTRTVSSTRSPSSVSSRSNTAWACTSTDASAGSSSPGPRARLRAHPFDLSVSPASRRCPPTPTSTATR